MAVVDRSRCCGRGSCRPVIGVSRSLAPSAGSNLHNSSAGMLAHPWEQDRVVTSCGRICQSSFGSVAVWSADIYVSDGYPHLCVPIHPERHPVCVGKHQNVKEPSAC